jgi:hypothetical protein
MYSEKGDCCNAHISLLLHVHIWHRGHNLSQLVKASESHKVTEETGMCTNSVSNGIAGLYSSYCMSCIQKMPIAGMPTFFAGVCSYLTWRPSFVTGDEWSQDYWSSICVMGTGSVKGYSWSMFMIFHALCWERGCWCNAQKYFAVACSSYLLQWS